MPDFELQEAPTEPADAPAGPISPDRSWSPLECWIWEKLRTGEIANIDEYEDEDGRLPPADPRKPEDWQDGRRRLAPRFLDDLLLCKPYHSGLHRKGVRIEGVWFDDEIDLEWAEVTRQIWLDRCRFQQPVRLAGLRTPLSVSFEGSVFAGDVVLTGAKIGGQVVLTGARVTGTLDMDSADIGRSLFMRSDNRVSEHRAEFNGVVLRGARVSGGVELIGAKVAGTLAMDSADIAQSLLMHSVSNKQAEFNEVVLRGTKVGGHIDLTGAKVTGTLAMDSADIAQSLLMHSVSNKQAEFSDVNLIGAKVGGLVGLIGAKVTGTLNMSAADIGISLLMRRDLGVSEHEAELERFSLRRNRFGIHNVRLL